LGGGYRRIRADDGGVYASEATVMISLMLRITKLAIVELEYLVKIDYSKNIGQ